MGLLHRVNLPPIGFLEYYRKLSQLYPVWMQPQVRLDRIIFPNLTLARNFIEDLPGTVWYTEKLEAKAKTCSDGCLTEIIEKNKEFQTKMLGYFELPSVHCSIDTAFQMGSLLNAFNLHKTDIQLELLILNTEETFETVKIFLQDKWNEFNIQKKPRCSLILPKYEIEYGSTDFDSRKHNKKRTRKISPELQNILRKIRPDLYPEIIGTEYYGHDVYNAFLQLHHLQSTNFQKIKALYPPNPMKYYDLQNEGEIELRFNQFIPLIVFDQWMSHLNRLKITLESEPLMIRCSYIYDAWNHEGLYKAAGKDRIVWSWNDIELALTQQNTGTISFFLDKKSQNNFAAVYFELTPMIESSDFRVDLFTHTFGIIPEMK